MAKKGFFSWFRKDKSQDEALAAEAEAQLKAQAAAEAQAQAEAAQFAAEETAKKDAAKLEAEAAAAQLAAEEAAKLEVEAAAAKLAEETAKQAAEAAAAQLAAEEAAKLEVEAAAAKLAEETAKQAAEAAAAQLAAEEAAKLEAEAAAAQLAAEEAAKLEAEATAAQLAAEEAAKLEAEATAAQLAAEEAAILEAEAAAAQLAAEEAAKLEAEAAAAQLAAEVAAKDSQPEPQQKPAKEGLFARLKRGLMRTSENIGSGFIGLFRGKKIDDDLFEELEEQLLIADVGVETTTKLINNLTDHASRKQLKDAEALYELLRKELHNTIEPVAIPLVPENAEGPFVILMVGVNGVGKTTTIGKLAKQYQNEGKSVMLAAGDTFRAAAVEQLQVWGQRNNIPVIAQHTGADSASVLFDALQAAKARKVDVLIADTAGRLQNKSHLMEELKKVVRVMKKLDIEAPHEIMLTLDASTGQNAISQAQLFQDAVGVTGISITKLDGTAKGGVIFAIADKFGIPIRYIGVGEQIDDLRQFNANDFIEALFNQDGDKA
ncbi:signal recognition particle-docking protein FtsY [Shewanella sp. NIFS-20-20]|uniref:signal recognition particle-docking protein FtsY n=1 Tax=Shewanella sp. NIFS-20-20 TaxID=2853806 RepID=UPI001C46EC75|nr:signal recognition particle-docking protein FtsY [Shewanella sp. NIFS-20-20]MBV7316321.1 signal recognition particle-docking protein FtsY [Shewanella sp. NIFS-20-20]